MVLISDGKRGQVVRSGQSAQELPAVEAVYVDALVRAPHSCARRVMRHAKAFDLHHKINKSIKIEHNIE